MSNSFFCTKPWTSFEISDHKGVVKPCCWSKLNCGNINESTVEQIWNGPGYQTMRQFMATGKLDAICACDCPYRVGEHTDIHYPEPQAELFKQNQTLQNQEIIERRKILKSKPSIMSIVPTVACNLKCIMCYQDRDDTVELPMDIQDTLFNYFPVLQELWILGGEPLISRQCIEIIENMEPELFPDIHLGLVTNGTVITDKIEYLLMKRQISWILVSIDAATTETFRKIRGGKLDKVINGVKRLRSIRTKQNVDWNLKIGFTLMRSNIHEVFAFVDLAKELGVNCQFSPIFGDDHGESLYNDPAILKHAIQTVLKLGDHLENRGFGRIRIARVLSRLKTMSSSSAANSFFDGDQSMDFETWEVEVHKEKNRYVEGNMRQYDRLNK